MLQITSIKNGIVLDHIKSGLGVKIFKYLHLGEMSNQVALIINAESKKNGKKDIIKIENMQEVNYTVLGMLSPGITINKVKNQEIVEKVKPELPKRVENIITCHNPNCITSEEKYLPQIFTMVNSKLGSYKCDYCENIINPSEV